MSSTDIVKLAMNRFLSKRKGAEASPPPQAGSKWRMTNKKALPEQMPQLATQKKTQIDLSLALPSSDEFRTSLIMPTLSTRFSMLREQDDPNSKLGKASDDSVLAPRRASRMPGFGFSPKKLNDIAEVASINSSFQTPSLQDRQDSCSTGEGYGTDDDGHGSIMSRARPREANTLFGGRQKVYRLGAGSARNINPTSEAGRLSCDDETNMPDLDKHPAYQRSEAERKREAASKQSDSLEDEETVPRISEDVDQGVGLGLTRSQSHGQSVNRASDSTTTSIPSQGRTSTAATSVASQSIGTAVTSSSTTSTTTAAPGVPPLERSLTKKRLYEQGLEKNTYEQQSSTMTRLNSLHRLRSPTIGGPMSPPLPSLHHSRSNGQMNERSFQPFMHSSTSSSAMRKPGSSTPSPITSSHPQSPLSPTMSESEEYQTLLLALEPGDRGKATAMGAFNKPKQQYDEEQYMQRQVQLQQSIQTHTSRPSSIDLTKRSGSSLSRFDSARQTNGAGARSRSGSTVHPPSPKVKHSPKTSFTGFHNGAKQAHGVPSVNPSQPPAGPLPPPPTTADTHRTFFGNISASDDEEEEVGSEYDQMSLFNSSAGRFNHAPLSSVSEHPATRYETSKLAEVDEEEEEEEDEQEEAEEVEVEEVAQPLRQTQSPIIVSTSQQTGTAQSGDIPEANGDDADLDSPTIGNENGIGGLIQHLRNISDQSSIYPPSHGRESVGYSAPAAWDLDELETYYAETPAENLTTRKAFFPAKGQPLAPSPSKGNISSRPSTRDSEIMDPAPWQTQLKKQHTREASTATQAERHAFDVELAARQKAIQEKMKSIVESESRATSPAPSAGGALKAFGMLKMKPSQESMPRDNGYKAMKLLGIDNQQHADSETTQQQAKSSIMAHPSTRGTPVNSQWPLGPSLEQKVIRNFSKSIPLQKAATTTTGTPRETSRERSNSSASKYKSGRGTNGYKDDFGSPPTAPRSTPVVRPSNETTRSTMQSSAAESRNGRLRAESKPDTHVDRNALHAPRNATPLGQMTPGQASPSSSVSPGNYTTASSGTPRPSYSTQSSFSTTSTPNTGVEHVPAMRAAGSVLRKKAVNKADIGVPKLISSTSNVETVDLPMARKIVQPPLIADLSPRRRVLAMQGRSASAGEVPTVAEQQIKAASTPPLLHAKSFAGSPQSKMSPESASGAAGARFDPVGSPVLNSSGMF